jgi:hypothetical protein
MAKAKGSPKTGGRKAGTPNKVQSPLRDKIKAFGEENFEEVIAAWNCIADPKDKVKAYIDIIAYAIPKLQAVQMDANIQRQSSIEDDLKKLSEEE